MTRPKKGSFAYIASKIRSEAKGTEFGFDFEQLCKFFLENDPIYAEVRKVWRWYDWPDRWGAEKGCDLVVQTKAGDYWAVQAKDYSLSRSVTKKNIDSFLAESSRDIFSYRLLITSTTRISPNALELFHATGKRKQRVPLGFVDRSGLEASPIKWPTTIGANPRQQKPKPLPKKPHQTKAVNAVVKGFKNHNRGRLIMACGTGKTNTALLISERLQAKRVLVLVPSLGLVKQFLSEWRQHRAIDFDYRLVCSDQTVDSNIKDPAIQRVADLGVPVVTTEVKDIRTFLGGRARTKKVVVSTYQSLEQIARAQRSKKIPPFDLIICDEAHRTAAATESYFSLVLDDKKIRSKRRLFMTATPKYVSGEIKEKAEEVGYNIISMDDEPVYGPEFHRLSFSEAIQLGELADYRLVVVGVTTSQAEALVKQAKIVRAKGIDKTDTYSLAKTLGLLKTIKKYKLRKIISFHRTIARAKQFVRSKNHDDLQTINNALPPRSRLTETLWANHINGEMNAGIRDATLQGLETLSRQSVGLISNVACLGEGIDVPDLDSVAFVDPKGSEIDIIQAVGRAIRKPRKSKKVSTIFAPIVIKEGDNEVDVFRTKEFKSVLKIVWALRSHDDDLGEILDKLRINLKNDPKSRQTHLPRKLVFDLPKKIGISHFHQKINTKVIRVSANPWDSYFTQLCAYKTIHGHCNVPMDAGAPFDLLAQWVNDVRGFYRRGALQSNRVSQLNAIGFRWTIDGQTLTDTPGLLSEQQVMEDWSQLIYKCRVNGLIVPYGWGVSATKLSAFYTPEQIQDLKSDLGITLDSVEGLLNPVELAGKLSYGTANPIYRRIKSGKVQPHGYSLPHIGDGNQLTPYFHPTQLKEIKTQLGITITNTRGLLNENTIREEYGLTKIQDYREKGLIQPKGKGVSGTAIGYLYEKTTVENFISQLKSGVTLSSTNGLYHLSGFINKTGFTNLAKYVEDGLIEPFGYAMNQGNLVAYFHPDQEKDLRESLGETLTSTKGLFDEKEANNITGLHIRNARTADKISPKGWKLMKTGRGYTLTPFYTKTELNRYKKDLGITLPTTDGLLSEPEFVREMGLDSKTIVDARKRGLLKPVGKAMNNSKVSFFYKPTQVGELKRSLGGLLDSTEGLLSETVVASTLKMSVQGITRYRKNKKIVPVGYKKTRGGLLAYYSADVLFKLRRLSPKSRKIVNDF
jgi:superfamily II DNA or RNA helicase